jgi:hypothetical protein
MQDFHLFCLLLYFDIFNLSVPRNPLYSLENFFFSYFVHPTRQAIPKSCLRGPAGVSPATPMGLNSEPFLI